MERKKEKDGEREMERWGEKEGGKRQKDAEEEKEYVKDDEGMGAGGGGKETKCGISKALAYTRHTMAGGIERQREEGREWNREKRAGT